MNELFEKISTIFKNDPEVAAVYLFGSYATGKAHDSSDLDLAILFTQPLSRMESYKRLESFFVRLSRLVGREVDLVDMEQANLILLHEILTEGKIIIENNKELNRAFRGQKMVECLDFLVTFRKFTKSMHARALERRKDG